jgi:hypothetical protein
MDGRTVTAVPSWRPDAVPTDDLLAGLKAAWALQQVPVSPWLSKQLANYSLRTATVLAERGVMVPEEGDGA